MRNIVLIGFMGCGKSTIGIKLSYKLHMTVEDTDKWIEKKKEKASWISLRKMVKLISEAWKPNA